MSTLDNLLTIAETREYLALNGVNWSEMWIRIQCWDRRLKSRKIWGRRLVERSSLEKIVRERTGHKS